MRYVQFPRVILLLALGCLAAALGVAMVTTAQADDDWHALHGEALRDAGLLLEMAGTGGDADFLVRTERYDAVILDLGLPDGDRTRWLAQWREDGIDLPVLVLTARERWSDKAAGFSAGADDYVTKPFETAEVLFRLRALVRRSHGHAHPVLNCSELVFDTHTGSVTLAGRPVTLTAQEAEAALGRLDERRSGSGLGLAIVEDLMTTLYGGRLKLDESRLGGVTAHVWLPGSLIWQDATGFGLSCPLSFNHAGDSHAQPTRGTQAALAGGRRYR